MGKKIAMKYKIRYLSKVVDLFHNGSGTDINGMNSLLCYHATGLSAICRIRVSYVTLLRDTPYILDTTKFKY